jgi:hypothetical protein
MEVIMHTERERETDTLSQGASEGKKVIIRIIFY